jgi:hypothetical protein
MAKGLTAIDCYNILLRQTRRVNRITGRVECDFEFAAPIIGNVGIHVPTKGRERKLNEPFGICGE